VTEVTRSVVCVSVCELFTLTYCTKTADLIEMPFGWLIRVGPRNHVLDRGQDLPAGKGSFWRLSGPLKSIETFCGVLSKRDHSVVNNNMHQRYISIACDVAFCQNTLITS